MFKKSQVLKLETSINCDIKLHLDCCYFLWTYWCCMSLCYLLIYTEREMQTNMYLLVKALAMLTQPAAHCIHQNTNEQKCLLAC